MERPSSSYRSRNPSRRPPRRRRLRERSSSSNRPRSARTGSGSMATGVTPVDSTSGSMVTAWWSVSTTSSYSRAGISIRTFGGSFRVTTGPAASMSASVITGRGSGTLPTTTRTTARGTPCRCIVLGHADRRPSARRRWGARLTRPPRTAAAVLSPLDRSGQSGPAPRQRGPRASSVSPPRVPHAPAACDAWPPRRVARAQWCELRDGLASGRRW